MNRVKVRYVGERASPLCYTIAPGGKVFTASGYMFGKVSNTNMLLEDEARVLANLDADAVNPDGSPVQRVVGGKTVPVKNRDLVTIGGNPIPPDDKFDVDMPKVKAAPKTKKENA